MDSGGCELVFNKVVVTGDFDDGREWGTYNYYPGGVLFGWFRFYFICLSLFFVLLRNFDDHVSQAPESSCMLRHLILPLPQRMFLFSNLKLLSGEAGPVTVTSWGGGGGENERTDEASPKPLLHLFRLWLWLSITQCVSPTALSIQGLIENLTELGTALLGIPSVVCTVCSQVLESPVHFIYTWTSFQKYKALHGLGCILGKAFTHSPISASRLLTSTSIPVNIKPALRLPLKDWHARHSLSFPTYIMG